MKTKKTQAEVNKEIAKLREMKPSVLRYSAFGDDHHAAIDAQVKVLTENLSEDDVDEKMDNEDWTDSVCSCAREAINWRDGFEEISPSENWKPLVNQAPVKQLRK